MKSGNLNFLEPSGPLQACNGTALPLLCDISYELKKNQALQTLRESSAIKSVELFHKILLPLYSYLKEFGHKMWCVFCIWHFILTGQFILLYTLIKESGKKPEFISRIRRDLHNFCG